MPAELKQTHIITTPWPIVHRPGSRVPPARHPSAHSGSKRAVTEETASLRRGIKIMVDQASGTRGRSYTPALESWTIIRPELVRIVRLQ